MTKIKVAVIEDIDTIRNSLKEFFNAQEETTCVIDADSMESFFEKETDADSPDVIICDIGLPGTNGIEGIKRIKNNDQNVDIIMFTVFDDSDKIFKAICAGANGYIVKHTPLQEIKTAIMSVYEGGAYMTPSIARKVLESFNPVKNTQIELLTAKEKQIVEGVTEGLSYKLIADKLSIKINTVKFHLKNIYTKLHINSKGELISKSFKGEL